MEILKGFTAQGICVLESLEYDQVIPLACDANNLLPNKNSKEISFPMFGRDPIVPLNFLFNSYSQGSRYKSEYSVPGNL